MLPGWLVCGAHTEGGGRSACATPRLLCLINRLSIPFCRTLKRNIADKPLCFPSLAAWYQPSQDQARFCAPCFTGTTGNFSSSNLTHLPTQAGLRTDCSFPGIPEEGRKVRSLLHCAHNLPGFASRPPLPDATELDFTFKIFIFIGSLSACQEPLLTILHMHKEFHSQ